MNYVPNNTKVDPPERMKKLKLKPIDPIDALDKRTQWEKSYRDVLGGE